MSAFGGEAQIFCSLSALPVVTDAVEKVSAKKLWNSNLKRWNPANRFLNQDCAFVLGLESMLLRDSLQNPFSTASTPTRTSD
jgi:hypothetical protein